MKPYNGLDEDTYQRLVRGETVQLVIPADSTREPELDDLYSWFRNFSGVTCSKVHRQDGMIALKVWVTDKVPTDTRTLIRARLNHTNLSKRTSNEESSSFDK